MHYERTLPLSRPSLSWKWQLYTCNLRWLWLPIGILFTMVRTSYGWNIHFLKFSQYNCFGSFHQLGELLGFKAVGKMSEMMHFYTKKYVLLCLCKIEIANSSKLIICILLSFSDNEKSKRKAQQRASGDLEVWI